VSLTPEQIQKYRELCEAATAGPWEHKPLGPYQWHTVFAPKGADLRGRVVGEIKPDYNAAFIAASRTALPQLLDAYRDLRELVDDLRLIIEAKNKDDGTRITLDALKAQTQQPDA
jgi:hypothetical protein